MLVKNAEDIVLFLRVSCRKDYRPIIPHRKAKKANLPSNRLCVPEVLVYLFCDAREDPACGRLGVGVRLAFEIAMAGRRGERGR